MTDEPPLSSEEILEINTHGPFNHSVWRGRGVTISHEEGLSGRVEFLSRTISGALDLRFAGQDLSSLSILDIGCYDGWMLHSLKGMGFGRYVGLDPRPANIARGRAVRRILNIPENAEFHEGSLERLPKAITDTQFDVVLCLGVLHHLSSVAEGLRILASLDSKVLFLESIVLPPELNTQSVEHALELKDIAYRGKKSVFGISGQKWEGAYYPGSAAQDTVVEVPSQSTLTMHLEALGYGKHKVLADWASYAEELPHLTRPVQAVCLEVEPTSTKTNAIKDVAFDVEYALIRSVLAPSIFQRIRELAPEALDEYLTRLLQSEHLEDSGGLRELLTGLRHNTHEKLQFEHAKQLIANGNIAEGAKELELLVTTVNTDWRVCYRSFFLLWHACSLMGQPKEAEANKARCLNCHPELPVRLFSEEFSWTCVPDEIFDEALSS